jgi:restriction endonuclease S subunit
MKFLKIFEPIQKGNFGLTDEAIYKSIQYDASFVPVWGGEQEHGTETRWISENGRTKYNEPITIFEGDGIVISLDGSAGRMTFIRDKRFALNHHAGFLMVRADARRTIDPEFFSIFYAKQLEEASIGEGGSRTLALRKIYSIDFDLPPFPVQQAIMEKLRPLLVEREKNRRILQRIESLNGRVLSNNYSTFQAADVPIRNILKCMGGNSGLTEEYLYSQIQNNAEKKYHILTGSTDYESSQYIHKCRHPKDSTKTIATIEGKAVIHVVRKGKAGVAKYFGAGNYTLTDDAYLLYLSDDVPYKVNLEWLSCVLKPRFLEYSSSSDNGTWNKTGFFRDVRIDVPSYPEQIVVVAAYNRLDELEKKLKKIDFQIGELLTKQITLDVTEA